MVKLFTVLPVIQREGEIERIVGNGSRCESIAFVDLVNANFLEEMIRLL